MTRNEPNSKSTDKYRAPGPSGSASSCSLEVIREDGSVTASGLADPRSSKPTHVAVHFDGALLSIAATYHSKWQQPVEGSISLPLDLRDPSVLFPILEGEKPWKAWPEIEALVRKATADLQVPRRFVRVFDRHLHILRAVRNGPKISKVLDALSTEKARKQALFRLRDEEVNRQIAGSIKQMQEILEIKSAIASELNGYGNALRHYQELLREKQKRQSQPERERLEDELRRLKEEERSRQRMKGARAHRT